MVSNKQVKPVLQFLPLLFLFTCFFSLGFCSLFQVIIWMLREGRGMIDTVFKIIQFFPSKLPQYQDHCVSGRHSDVLLLSVALIRGLVSSERKKIFHIIKKKKNHPLLIIKHYLMSVKMNLFCVFPFLHRANMKCS